MHPPVSLRLAYRRVVGVSSLDGYSRNFNPNPSTSGNVRRASRTGYVFLYEGRCKATWKKEFKLPWREAGPRNHHDDKVDSDQ